MKNLIKNVDEYRSSCGYFFEYHASSLSEINKIINKKYQTLAYYGITHNELNEFVKKENPKLIDRITFNWIEPQTFLWFGMVLT